MKIYKDNIELCDDCSIVVTNADYSVVDYSCSGWVCLTCTREGSRHAPDACPWCGSEADANHGPHENAELRVAEIDAGLAALVAGIPSGYLVPDYDAETGRGIEEFSSRRCCGCGRGAGSRHSFAVRGLGIRDERE